MARSATSRSGEFDLQNEAAIREAREADRIEPRASAVRYDPRNGLILVDLRSGFAFGFPPERIAGLARSSAKELSTVQISPSGDGLHWEQLDIHVSLTGLMSEALKLLRVGATHHVPSEERGEGSRVTPERVEGGRPRHVAKRARKTKK